MKFDIRDYLDRLKLERTTSTQAKYYCPNCGNDNLTVNLLSGKWCCFRWV